MAAKLLKMRLWPGEDGEGMVSWVPLVSPSFFLSYSNGFPVLQVGKVVGKTMKDRKKRAQVPIQKSTLLISSTYSRKQWKRSVTDISGEILCGQPIPPSSLLFSLPSFPLTPPKP